MAPTHLTDDDIKTEWTQSTPRAQADDDATDGGADDDATDDATDEADGGADDDATDA